MGKDGEAEIVGNTRRLISACLIALCALSVGLSGLLSSPALAKDLIRHGFSTSFGKAGTGSGELLLTPFKGGGEGEPAGPGSGLAVNQQTGDLYVADTGNERIEEFEADGAFVRTFAVAGAPTLIAVDNSSSLSKGDVYVVDSSTNTVLKFDANGAPITNWGESGRLNGSTASSPISGPFASLAGLAVDSSGDLWVYDTNEHMFEFAQDGSFETDWDSHRGVTPAGSAVDSSGDLYVVNGNPGITKFTPSGTQIGDVLDEFPVTGLAIDPSGDDLYVDSGSIVSQFEVSCEPVGHECARTDVFGSEEAAGGELESAAGLAVGASHIVYVADVDKQRIDVFHATILVLPDATTAAASQVKPSTATLNGTINAASGPAASCAFQYATAEAFGDHGFEGAAEVPCTPAGTFTGSSSEAVHADLTGLSTETSYDFRLLGTNENGADPGEAVAFTTPPAVKEVLTGKASQLTSTSATLNGSINPGGIQLTECTFELIEDSLFKEAGEIGFKPGEIFANFAHSQACEVPAAAEVPPDEVLHPVHAGVAGLSPGNYDYRLRGATTAGSIAGAERAFSVVSAPTVLASSAAPGHTEVEFRATINPGNATTTYRFEFGSTEAYGQSSSSGTVPAGTAPVVVSSKVALRPATTYHFRVLAENAVATVASVDKSFATLAPAQPQPCPNDALRTGASATLPDCRAYEMVTPPAKNGQLALPAESSNQAVTSDGSAANFSSIGAFGEPGDDSSAIGGDYIATRTAAGWSSRPVNPAAVDFHGFNSSEEVAGSETVDYDQNLRQTLFLQAPIYAKAIDARFYIRHEDGSFVELGPTVPPAVVSAWNQNSAEHGDTPGIAYDGASPGFSKVVFTSTVRPTLSHWQWPGDPTKISRSLYVLDGAGAEPELLAVKNSRPLREEAALGHKAHVNEAAEVIGECGASLGSAIGTQYDAYNAIADGGAKIFFTVFALTESCERAGGSVAPAGDEIYARVDGSQATAISEPGPSDCEACLASPVQRAIFQGASNDGSRVFFLSAQALLPGASEENLYEYNFDATDPHEKLTLVGTDLAEVPERSADEAIGGVARVSEDGSHVYFVSQAVLADNLDAKGEGAKSGDENFYVNEPDPAHPGEDHTVFIAALALQDHEDWRAEDDQRPVAATPDGRFVLFASVNDLTPDASGSAQQLYRYDATAGQLTRITIGEGGFNSDGNGAGAFVFTSENYQTDHARSPMVSISDDGSRIFFAGAGALTPTALNDSCAYAESGVCVARAGNVYEWEDGNIYLLSDGRDSASVLRGSATGLLGANPSGSDVFIKTADQLVSQDGDTQADIYDVRIDGGFPPISTALGCAGEACQGVPVLPPAFGAPSSAILSGPGNQVAAVPRNGKPKPPTRAQKLARALKACRRHRSKRVRRSCESQARKSYTVGAKPKSRKGGK